MEEEFGGEVQEGGGGGERMGRGWNGHSGAFSMRSEVGRKVREG